MWALPPSPEDNEPSPPASFAPVASAEAPIVANPVVAIAVQSAEAVDAAKTAEAEMEDEVKTTKEEAGK